MMNILRKKQNIFSIMICLMVLLMVLLMITVKIEGYAKDENIIIIRLAHTQPEVNIFDTPYMALTSVFKNIVERNSLGRIKVEVYPSGQFGGIISTLEQCERGIIEATTAQNSCMLASYCQDVQVLDIPYIFRDLEVARVVLNGEFGKMLSDRIAESCSLRVLTWLPTAMRNFATTRKIVVREPKDLKGIKIRTMQTPIYIELLKGLGAAPTPVPWMELYTSLQTGVIDGHDNPPYIMRTMKFYEVSKNYTLDQHTLNVMGFYINKQFFQSLSKEDQKLLKHAANEAQLAMLGIVRASEGRDLEWLVEKGLNIITLTPQEKDAFRKATLPIILEYLEGKVDKSILNSLIDAIKNAEREIDSK